MYNRTSKVFLTRKCILLRNLEAEMNQVSVQVGEKIRKYRKDRGITLQQLADAIHKSRSSVSKYENGEISLDIQTLFEIAEILQVSHERLLDIRPRVPAEFVKPVIYSGVSPFFQARRLYFYFYDGRHKRLKDGIIDIRESEETPGNYEADLTITAVGPTGRSSEVYYKGKVIYSHMLIRFSFVNQYNTLEEDLLYIFNPLELRDTTEGLLCGISSMDLMPCAFKCLVTLTPREHTEELKEQLLFSKKELRKWQKSNMLLIDNRGE